MSTDPDQAPDPRLAAKILDIRSRMGDGHPVDAIIAELARLRLMVDDADRARRALAAQASFREVVLPMTSEVVAGRLRAAFTAASALGSAQGFYDMECDDRGRPFRWTGPTTMSFVDLVLDRRGLLAFQIRFASWSDRDLVSGVRVFIDGIEVPVERHLFADMVIVAGVLPRAVDTGVSRLAFRIARVRLPKPTGEAEKRSLGVAFLGMEVAPSSDLPIPVGAELLVAAPILGEVGP